MEEEHILVLHGNIPEGIGVVLCRNQRDADVKLYSFVRDNHPHIRRRKKYRASVTMKNGFVWMFAWVGNGDNVRGIKPDVLITTETHLLNDPFVQYMIGRSMYHVHARDLNYSEE